MSTETAGMDSSKCHHLLTIYMTLIGLCCGEGVLPDNHCAREGGSVVLTTNCSLTASEITWIFKGTSFNTSVDVIVYTPTLNTTYAGYGGRITLNSSSGSLELRGLTMEDSGLYEVTILSDVTHLQGNTTLTVISEVRLSGGAIAGIVIAVVVLVVLIICLVVYTVKKLLLLKGYYNDSRPANMNGQGRINQMSLSRGRIESQFGLRTRISLPVQLTTLTSKWIQAAILKTCLALSLEP